MVVKGPIVEPRRRDGAVPFVTDENVLGMSFPWVLTRGKMTHTLVVKATCDIALPSGPATLRAEADAPTGDEHVLDPPMSSLRYPSDLAVLKARCDVALWGHAYGRGRPSTEVRFKFGSDERGRGFDRRMRVFGPRPWSGLRPGKAQAFEKVPLMWEMSARHDEHNPVGRTHDGKLAPQLESIDEESVAGFGAIPLMWPERLRRFGTYDMRWYERRHPYFAEDFDPEAFQAAPRAQQLEHINGDESFVVEGLHPEHRILEGQLPGLQARAYAVSPSPDGGTFEEVPLRLDTVFFDLEHGCIQLIWRGTCPVIDEHASNVSAWHAHVFAAEPDEQTMKVSFWRRFDPEFAAMLDGETAEAPPAEPLPVTWLAADEDPSRKAVEAWLAGGEAPAGDLAGAELSGLDFSGRDLSGWVLRAAHLEGCRFIETMLDDAELAGAVAPGALFDRASMNRADLSEATLVGARFTGAKLVEADLTDCKADRAELDEVVATAAQLAGGSFDNATFVGAKLDEAVLSEASLIEANFNAASLHGARLYDTNASRATFEKADLTELRADGVILIGANCDGAKATDAVFDDADLTDICWRKASLPAVSMTNAVALRARFIAVDMRGALMKNANLAGADFRTSDLMEADLARADLSGADLRGANLYGAELQNAKLDDAQIEGALIGQTILGDT